MKCSGRRRKGLADGQNLGSEGKKIICRLEPSGNQVNGDDVYRNGGDQERKTESLLVCCC